MAIDSAASLLFNIGANTDDAEGNIQRFRGLMGKDLGDLGGEFSDWSSKVFGDLNTVQGAMTAMAAVTVAGVIAVGGAMLEFADKHAEYVEEVERGSRATGISTENMSGLKFMADETGTSYDSLVTGLTRFTSTVVKAADGSDQQLQAFARLGISQAQVAAGEKDLMPLLELVADRFKGLGSQVDRTALARELFSRGGASLVRMLSLGSEGIREFEKEAAKLGLTVTTQDVVAMEQFRATSKATSAQMESLGNEIGKFTMPIVEDFKQGVLALAIAIHDLPHALKGDFWQTFRQDVGEANDRIARLAHALATLPADGKPLDDLGDKAQKLKDSFSGLSDLLHTVQERTQETAGEQGRLDAEFEKLNDELVKAYSNYQKLHAQGQLTAQDAKEQAAALALLPGALAALHEALQSQSDEKAAAAVRAAGETLQELVLRQGEQTLEMKGRLLDLDVAKRREAMQKEHTDTAENLAWLAAYEVGARQKITAGEIAEIEKAGAEISAKRATEEVKSASQQAVAWNQEVDRMAGVYRKEGTLTAENEAALAALRKQGLDKIAADEKAAFDSQMARLGEQLERIEKSHQTAEERIRDTYAADVARYSAAEQQKVLLLATSEAQRQQIIQQFATIRTALLTKEGQDLQALHNSQGWQGVFGSQFQQDIRNNEALMKQWAMSSNQSLLMVQVAMESLKEMAQKTFDQFAQGMGAGIAHAIVYEQSIGKAMEAALKSTLESLASQAYVHAIYSLALGFLDLAEGNETGAVAAFEAAAIFAAVGTAAALVGRAIPGGGSSAGGGAGSGAPASSSQQQAQTADQQSGAVGAPGGGGGPHVTVNVYGHVVGTSGVAQLAGMLNDAVLNSGVTLTASNTTTGKQVGQ